MRNAKTAVSPVRPARTTGAKKAAPSKPATPKSASPVEAASRPVSAAEAAPDQKVVRDGFTMPKGDYEVLKALKAQCLKSGVEVKKSELLRAGVLALAALPAAELLSRMRALPAVKAGRKKK